MAGTASQATDSPGAGNRRRSIIALLVGASLLAMGNVLGNGFTAFDDEHTIWQNPRFSPPKWTGPDSIASYWWEWRKGHLGLYIPFTYTVWGTVAQATYVQTGDDMQNHLDARAFHAVSLLLHIGSALLVFWIVRCVLSRAANKSDAQVDWGAAIGALVFATHPLQVESIAWTSGMKDLLCAFFSLAAIACYMTSAQGRRMVWYGAGTVLLALGLLSKPAAMVTPGLILVIEWLGCGFKEQTGWRGAGLRLLPWVVICAMIGAIAKTVQPGTGIESGALWQRPVVAGASLSFYLWKLIWPVGLGFDYGWRPPLMLQQKWFYAIAIIPLLLAMVLWTRWHRWRVLVGAASIFVIGLGPVLGLVRFSYQFYSTVADHYVYLSMLGVALAIGCGALELPARMFKGVIAACAGVVLVFALLSLLQLNHWRNIQACVLRTLAVNPNSVMGHTNYGQWLLLQGDVDAALIHFRRAVEIQPRLAIAWDNLVQVEARLGDYEQMMRDFEGYRRAMLHNAEQPIVPPTANDYLAGGLPLAQKGYWGAAERFVLEASRIDPDNQKVAQTLEHVRKMRTPATTRTTTAPAG